MQESKLKLLQQAKKYYSNEGFNILGLFGSYARGEENPHNKTLHQTGKPIGEVNPISYIYLT